jgi:hypothetical protein
MASRAAYYEGLQYANRNVKPVDFGALALGIADVEKEKFNRAEKERKEKEAFDLAITDKYGDIIYPTFDKTGLENVDIYQTGVVDMISSRAEDLNDRYNSGEINKIQLNREMAKLKGQTQQFRNNFDMISKFVENYQAMGDNIDPSSQDTMQELQALFSDAKPYLTADNRLGNISAVRNEKGELEPRGFLWDKAASMLQVDAKYDTFGIPKQILGIQGELSKFIGTQEIINTHLTKEGGLKDGTVSLIQESIDALSDRQIISYARQMGLDPDYDPTDITSLRNRNDLESKIIEDQKQKTLALLQQKGSLDEMAYAEYSLKLKQLDQRERALRERSNKQPSYDKSYYNVSSAKQSGYDTDYFEYTFKSPKSIKGFEGAGFGEFIGKDYTNMIGDPTVVSYMTDGSGMHVAKVAYQVQKPVIKNGKTIPDQFVKENKVLEIPLTKRRQINQVRSVYGIPVLSDEEISSLDEIASGDQIFGVNE